MVCSIKFSVKKMRYNAYKMYLYDWLLEIPNHWTIKSLRGIFTLSDERKGNQDLQLLSVYREYGVIPKDSRDDNRNIESEDTSKYQNRYVITIICFLTIFPFVVT